MEIFSQLSEILQNGGLLSYGVALIAGIISFFAPCSFAMLPTFITVIIYENQPEELVSPQRRFQRTLVYILSFSLTYFLLGFGFIQLSSFIKGSADFWNIFSGLLLILFGLLLLYGEKFNLSLSGKTYTLQNLFTDRVSSRYLPVAMGIASATAWTPCVGPILGGILTLASASTDSPMRGGILLLIFAVGFAIPFLIFSYTYAHSIVQLQDKVKDFRKLAVNLHKLSAILLIMTGVFLMFGLVDDMYNLLYDQYNKLGFEGI